MSTANVQAPQFSDLSSFDMIVLGVIGSLIGESKSSPMSLTEITNIINKHPLVSLVREKIDFNTSVNALKPAELPDVIRSIKVMFKGTSAITINQNNKDHFDFLMTKEEFQEFVKDFEMEYREDMLTDIKDIEMQYFEKIQKIDLIERGKLDDALIKEYQIHMKSRKNLDSPNILANKPIPPMDIHKSDHTRPPDISESSAISHPSVTTDSKTLTSSNPMVLTPIKAKPGNIAQTLASNRMASSQQRAATLVNSPSTTPLTPIKITQIPKHDIKPYPNVKATISPPKSMSPGLMNSNASVSRTAQPDANESQTTSRKVSISQTENNISSEPRLEPTQSLSSSNSPLSSISGALQINDGPSKNLPSTPSSTKLTESTKQIPHVPKSTTTPYTPFITTPSVSLKQNPQNSSTQTTPSKPQALSSSIQKPVDAGVPSLPPNTGTLSIGSSLTTGQAINPFYPANNQAQVKSSSILASNSNANLFTGNTSISKPTPIKASAELPNISRESSHSNNIATLTPSRKNSNSGLAIDDFESSESIVTSNDSMISGNSGIKRSFDNFVGESDSVKTADLRIQPDLKKIRIDDEDEIEAPGNGVDSRLPIACDQNDKNSFYSQNIENISMKNTQDCVENFEDAKEYIALSQSSKENKGSEESEEGLKRKPLVLCSSKETKDHQETHKYEEATAIEMKDINLGNPESSAIVANTTAKANIIDITDVESKQSLKLQEVLKNDETDQEQAKGQDASVNSTDEFPKKTDFPALSQEAPSYATQNKKLSALAQNLLDTLSSHKLATPFLQPVTQSISDYDTIVKEPRDFKTIKQMVKDGRIQTIEELKRDILLMFANAVMFNQTGTEISDWAKVLTEESDNVWEMFEENLKDL